MHKETEEVYTKEDQREMVTETISRHTANTRIAIIRDIRIQQLHTKVHSSTKQEKERCQIQEEALKEANEVI